MPTFLPDSSCIVARLCEWQPHHAAARDELDRRLLGGEMMIVAASSLVEAYSVLTDTVLTVNVRHFGSFAGPDLRVVVPMEG